MAGLSGMTGLSGLSGLFGGIDIPLTVDGLQLWLKADAGTFQDSDKTVEAINDGDVVGNWEDQSGNGNDATQSTTPNKPLLKLEIVNEKSVVRYDGINDKLSSALDLALSTNDNLSIFFVTRPVLDASVKVILGNQSDDGNRPGMRVSYDSSERIEFFTDDSGGGSTSVITGVEIDFVVGLALLDNGSQEIYINGSLEDSDTQLDLSGHSTNLFIGINRLAGGAELDGDIAEVLIYNSALSASNRSLIENYLNERYAIF